MIKHVGEFPMEKAIEAMVEALEALEFFENTGDRSLFGKWLDKYSDYIKETKEDCFGGENVINP